jgi:hypothetical protein
MMSETEPKPGGQPGNVNRIAKLPWPENVNLNDPDSILAYQAKLIELMHTGWLSGRQAGALNNAIAIRLRYFLDAQKVKQLEKQVAEIMKLLPPEIKAKLEVDLKNET